MIHSYCILKKIRYKHKKPLLVITEGFLIHGKNEQYSNLVALLEFLVDLWKVSSFFSTDWQISSLSHHIPGSSHRTHILWLSLKFLFLQWDNGQHLQTLNSYRKMAAPYCSVWRYSKHTALLCRNCELIVFNYHSSIHCVHLSLQIQRKYPTF